MRKLIPILTRLSLLAALLLAGAQALSGPVLAGPGGGGGGGGKPPKEPTAEPPPPGDGSRIAFAELVTVGKGKNKTSSLQVMAALPDGSDKIRVSTDDNTNHRPLDWAADGWMAVSNEGTVRILDVPPSSPGGATEVASFALDTARAKWSAQVDAGGAVLPTSQQLLAFTEASDGGGTRNVVATRHDGTGQVAVTSHVSTCVPAVSPGCTGSRYVTELFGWLPSDPAAQTIRVLYGLREHAYVGGSPAGETMTYRVATLDTSTWPAPTVAGDDPVQFGGAPVTAVNLTVSRDGSYVAYDENLGAPSENHINVAPLEYDAFTGATTLRSDLAGIRADASGTGYVVSSAGGFSPDNAQIVVFGWTTAAAQFDVFVADAAAPGPPTEVDGTDRQADSPIWGP